MLYQSFQPLFGARLLRKHFYLTIEPVGHFIIGHHHAVFNRLRKNQLLVDQPVKNFYSGDWGSSLFCMAID